MRFNRQICHLHTQRREYFGAFSRLCIRTQKHKQNTDIGYSHHVMIVQYSMRVNTAKQAKKKKKREKNNNRTNPSEYFTSVKLAALYCSLNKCKL